MKLEKKVLQSVTGFWIRRSISDSNTPNEMNP